MTEAVSAKLLDRFMTLYGEPKTDNPQAFIEEYAKALGGFNERVLEQGANEVIRAHTFPGWPTVGECVKACKTAADRLYPSRPPEHLAFSALTAAKQAPSQEEARAVMGMVRASFEHCNSFSDIQARCPVGGTINIRAPWGEEVRDASGKIVPIRKRKGTAA